MPDDGGRNQYRTLVGMLLRNQVRGRNGKSRYGRLLSISISYIIAAVYLGWSLTQGFYEPAYLVVTFSVMLYVAGFTFIGSYPLILLDKSDRLILQQFPISERTLSFARLTNLSIYILYVTIPFAVPLAAMYGWQTGNPFQAFVYGFVMLAASLWATLFFLLFTLKLFQKSHRFHAVLSGMQMLLVFGLLIFFQAMPRYFIHDIEWESLFSGVWAYLLPPFWLVGMFRTLTLDIAGAQGLVVTGLFLASAAFMAHGISGSWMIPLDALQNGNKTRKNPVLLWLDNVVLEHLRNSTVRAGYDFFIGTALKERTIRLQIIPMALMPIAAALYGILSGELSSPFPQILTGWYSKMHIPVLVFYLFIARHIEHVTMFSPVPNAQWIMQMYTGQGLQGFRSGVRMAGKVRILLPLAAVLLVLFNATMPFIEAALQAAFLFLAGTTQSALFALTGKRVPFTENVNQVEAFRRVSQLFIVLPFMILFWLLHYFTSTSYISFSLMLAGLALFSVLAGKLAQQRKLVLPAW